MCHVPLTTCAAGRRSARANLVRLGRVTVECRHLRLSALASGDLAVCERVNEVRRRFDGDTDIVVSARREFSLGRHSHYSQHLSVLFQHSARREYSLGRHSHYSQVPTSNNQHRSVSVLATPSALSNNTISASHLARQTSVVSLVSDRGSSTEACGLLCGRG